MPDYIMPHWSKYRGKDISRCPRHYLNWLIDWIEEENLQERNADLLTAIDEELEQRDRSHDKF